MKLYEIAFALLSISSLKPFTYAEFSSADSFSAPEGGVVNERDMKNNRNLLEDGYIHHPWCPYKCRHSHSIVHHCMWRFIGCRPRYSHLCHKIENLDYHGVDEIDTIPGDYEHGLEVHEEIGEVEISGGLDGIDVEDADDIEGGAGVVTVEGTGEITAEVEYEVSGV